METKTEKTTIVDANIIDIDNNIQIMNNMNNMPNLHEAQVTPMSINSDYWSPKHKGEYVVGTVISIDVEKVRNLYKTLDSDPDNIELKVIKFLSQQKDGSFKTITNGSKTLVPSIERSIENKSIVLLQTFIRIEYKGKKPNKTNSYMSDDWSIKKIHIS